MDFLDKLYSSNYFGIGLFAVIAFLVVTFLVVLFFGKKDEKKRKLEETTKVGVTNENAFKETTPVTPVEIPVNPEPVAPINLEPAAPVAPVEPVVPIQTESTVNTQARENIPVPPVMPVPPVEPVKVEENNEYVDNLTVEEPVRPVIETPHVEPIITPVTKIEQREEIKPSIELEPTKIEIPKEPVTPIIEPVIPKVSEPVSPVRENVTPVIKEEEPKLQINEEPIINTYYKPSEKPKEVESIKVPNIDFDSLAKSISKELDELENDSRKYDEIKVTPMSEVTKTRTARQPETFSSVYVREEAKETPKETIDLPKKIDLPAKKSE